MEEKSSIRWSIKIKLFVGFGFILWIVLSISVIAYYSLTKVQQGAQRIRLENDTLIKITTIHATLIELELLVYKFHYHNESPTEHEVLPKAKEFVSFCVDYLSSCENPLEWGQLQYLIGRGRDLIYSLEHWETLTTEEITLFFEILYQTREKITFELKKFREGRTNKRITDLEERSQRHGYRFLLSGLILSFGAAFLFIFLFSRFIYAPLIALYQGAKHISRGNLGYQLHIPSSDEIGELAQEFNQMSLQLQKSYSDLETQLERRSEKLKSIEQQLSASERLASIGTLAAGVAHEINNPLTLIGVCTDGLLHRAKQPVLLAIEEFKPFPEYLKKIDDEIYRCKKITRGLLDFAKKQPPEIKEINIFETLSQTILLLHQQALSQNKKVRLLTETPPETLIPIDPFILKQILINLVLNAIEASKPHTEILVRYCVSKELLHLQVEDEGEGIHEKIIGKIFDPFFTTKHNGTGLGLTICYGLAKKYGGLLSAKNKEKGNGALFELRLPLTSP
jgi:signal transduction histidine kinase